jgi:Family of unknown function (DUF6444)
MVRGVTQRDWRDDRIDELEQQLKAALERIAELEERLGTSSRNSSKPPSSDSPKQQADRKKKAAAITKHFSKKRKPGGQPGHKGFSRALVPPAEVDRHHDCIPESCENCEAKLGDRDPSPQLHQVFKLPEVRPEVDQYALHAVECAGCGHVTRGRLPPGVPTGAFGPSVIAMNRQNLHQDTTASSMPCGFSWNVLELNQRITPRRERCVTASCGAKSAEVRIASRVAVSPNEY